LPPLLLNRRISNEKEHGRQQGSHHDGTARDHENSLSVLLPVCLKPRALFESSCNTW
jgi:hypothetical protein